MKSVRNINLLLLIGLAMWIFFANRETKPEVIEQSSQNLTGEAYATAKNHYVGLVNNSGPIAAIEALRTDSAADNNLARSCHALVHEIGRATYNKLQNFAQSIKDNDSFCNSGFMHGVIEEHFSSVPNVEEEIKTVCSQYSADKYLGWECYHGVGHGLMFFSNNDLPKSIEMCSAYQDSSAASACANGVFMENFGSDQKLHPTQFLKDDNLFYPCEDQKNNFKSDCYLYAPTRYLNLHPNNYSEALNWCNDTPEDFVETCVEGVGSQTMKENINNPKSVESICLQNSDFTKKCVSGMIGIYAFHYGSLEPVSKLCPILAEPNRKICEDYTTRLKKFFE